MNIFYLIGIVCFVSCYIPQIRKVYKSKSAGDITPTFQTLEAIGALSLMTYCFIIGNNYLVAYYCILLIMIGILLHGVLLYK